MTRRIGVFLGGYLNAVNSQNLNCLALARHLDKTKFSVYAMLHPAGDLEYASIDGVQVFRCWRPMRVCQYLVYLWGTLKSDVVYLPKRELAAFNRLISRLFGRSLFVTVEGVIAGPTYDRFLAAVGSRDAVSRIYDFSDATYSITQYMADYNDRVVHIHSDGVLYLGVDTDLFSVPDRTPEPLSNLVFIGNNMRWKGIEDYLQLAACFPHLQFHVVGSGLGEYDLAAELTGRPLANVIRHGALAPAGIVELLRRVQLHVLPSRAEGFPKVTLETAAAGIPSIVYGDYGASEWITTGENGFVVSRFEEIRTAVAQLIDQPAELWRLSRNAVRLGESFDWKRRVKDWERVITELAE